jgi:hypothetical protein
LFRLLLLDPHLGLHLVLFRVFLLDPLYLVLFRVFLLDPLPLVILVLQDYLDLLQERITLNI